MRLDLPNEVRRSLTDPRDVCERLGMLGSRRGRDFVVQPRGVTIRCPWHKENTPSCSVTRADDGTIRVRCFGCDKGSDVFGLVAAQQGLDLRGADFVRVVRAAAELGGLWGVVAELDTRQGADTAHTPTTPMPTAPPRPPVDATAAPPRDYPAREEVASLWEASSPVGERDDICVHLAARAIDPDLVDASGLARVIPNGYRLPRWASYQRRTWTETGHRLIVPMYDAEGTMRSVRAWRVVDGDTPKRLPPGGHLATGLVMACPIGVAMLSGKRTVTEAAVLEGEPNWMTWATRRLATPTACIGIVSGSFTPAIAAAFTFGATVWIRTDYDTAGDKYAATVAEALRRRCFVQRTPPGEPS